MELVKMKKIILLSLLLVSACGNLWNIESDPEENKYEAMLNSWMGKTKSDLLKTWGVPSSTYQVDKREEMIEFKRAHDGFTQYGSYNYYCITTFTLKNGKVSYWNYRGNTCIID